MAGPPCGVPVLQDSYGVGDGSNSVNHKSSSSGSCGYSSSVVPYDPVLDELLCELLQQREDQRDSGGAHSLNTSINGTQNYGSPGGFHGTTPAAQTEFKVQPRVYERSLSFSKTYNPPPDCKVLQFQCLPIDHDPPLPSMPGPHPLRHADVVMQADQPSVLTGFPHLPLHPPAPCTYSDQLPSPVFFTSSMSSAHPRPPAGLVSHINMPAHIQPLFPIHPAYPNNSSIQLQGVGANFIDSNLGPTQGIHDSEHMSFSFHPPCNYNILQSQTTVSDSDQQNLMEYGISGVDICHESSISCPTSRGTSSMYMQSSYSPGAVSDSVAMEISGIFTPTSTSSQTNSERRCVSVPHSPSPSVNKVNATHDASTPQTDCMRSTRSSRDELDGVQFKVKTGRLDLYDGFSWRKYGEKNIKKTIHRRGYYRCERSTGSGCIVRKHTQRCPHDEEYVLFTYFGKHNHHP